MFSKFVKVFTALSLLAAAGVVTVSKSADARPASCSKGVGGTWYCR